MPSITDSPFEVKTSGLLGRYLVAKRDLSEGTLIFEEAPLYVYSKFEETIWDRGKSYCISCYQLLEATNVVKCTKCKWPFCSRECSKDRRHLSGECLIFCKYGVLPASHAGMMCVLCLLRLEQLKKRERKKWETIMSLVSKHSICNPKGEDFIHKQALWAQKFLEHCNMKVTFEHVQEVINMFRINSFGLRAGTDNAFRCVYEVCSLFSHSCSPNVEWYHLTNRKTRGTMGILPRRDIAAGELVTISYSEDIVNLGSRHRQVLMLECCSFMCACSRCLDPSEFNNFYSAIKCNKCCDGWLLPPACFSQENQSICNKCSHLMPSAETERIEFVFRRKVVAALKEKRVVRKREWKSLDRLISDATSKYKLHPKHNLVIFAIQRWLTSRDFGRLLKYNEKSRILCEKMVERAKLCLEINTSFGTISDRVTWESIISCALIRYHFKSLDYLHIKEDIEYPVAKIKIMSKIVTHLSNVVHLLRFKFFDSATGAILRDMSERYVIWEERLSRYSRNCRL